jgi:adenylate cyclase
LTEGNSLAGVKAVVAAPILNPQGDAIGALYGDRRQEASFVAHPITRLEAMLVDLLASGVAAGLARVEQEQAALRARVQFEQFFTPQLARQLEIRPELLRGQDASVSILFCDIRGFSRISERLGPEGTVEWIRAVMGALSECVQEHGGVLVDYIGDELMAMWGAPEEQPDHAQRACRAALAMRARLPSLNARWQPVLHEEMDVGIGVNSGVARVGDIGSALKFKYGVLGNTVNLCSRVQGATKYLKTPALVTEATRSQLGPEFALRRLGRVRVVNIVDPVTLYELAGAPAPAWERLRQTYEEALASFESKQFRLAARKLGELLHEHPDDGPSLVLMARTVNCLVDEPLTFEPVWELPGK